MVHPLAAWSLNPRLEPSIKARASEGARITHIYSIENTISLACGNGGVRFRQAQTVLRSRGCLLLDGNNANAAKLCRRRFQAMVKGGYNDESLHKSDQAADEERQCAATTHCISRVAESKMRIGRAAGGADDGRRDA